MKKLFFLAVATFGMLLSTSCSKSDNDTSIDKVNVSLKVIITKDILSLGTAKVMLGEETLKNFSGTDTSYSHTIEINKFPYKNTLKLVFTRDASKEIESGKMYNLRWRYDTSGESTLKNGEKSSITGMNKVGQDGGTTNVSKIIENIYKNPVTILEINLNDDGTYVPAD